MTVAASPAPSSRAELVRAVNECDAHLAKLAKEFEDAQNDAALDYYDAHEAVERLPPLIETAEAASSAARAALQQFDAKEAAAERRAVAEADTTRPYRIAELVREYQATFARTEEAATALSAAMIAQVDAGVRLGEAIGGDARRQFSLLYILERICYGLEKKFVRRSEPDKGQTRRGHLGTVVRLLDGLRTLSDTHVWCKMTLPEIESSAVANLVDFYADRPSAEAARKHRDPGGQNWHVVEGRDGIFRLVEGTRRMSRSAA